MSEFKGTPGTLDKRANKRRFNIGDPIIASRSDGSCERGIITGIYSTALREPYYWCRIEGGLGVRAAVTDYLVVRDGEAGGCEPHEVDAVLSQALWEMGGGKRHAAGGR